jgi:hypothetical protein
VNMNKAILTLLLIAAASFFLKSCASFPREQEMRSMARVYDKPYDTVYSSVKELLRRDLSCAMKKDDKSGGELETEWVHRMDTEGKKRWMVKASVRKVPKGTEVVFYKKSDLQDEVSKSLDKYNQKKKDQPETAAGGWKKIDVDMASIDDLYRRLEKRLDAQE